ncbi:MAG: hypothetical protein GY862_39380, partial [Gammaproteobacteria bacterium]|nr:hypothetical protein [Gammaproteobacteria bacterium]
MNCHKVVLVSIIVFITVWALPAHAGDDRLALVIGNSKYTDTPLRNPANDAQDMAEALRAVGFEVLLHQNIGRMEMGKAVQTFGRRLQRGGVGLFFFAGHGLQFRGQNYLVPIDAQIKDEADAELMAITIDFILKRMADANNGLNIIILDACRNNPYAKQFRSLTRGLARIDGPVGTFIAYSTAPGKVADDGPGRNGIYTKHLLAKINAKGLQIEEMFRQVRVSVAQETNHLQIPWDASSLMKPFCFGGCAPHPPAQAGEAASPNASEAAAILPSVSTARPSTPPSPIQQHRPNSLKTPCALPPGFMPKTFVSSEQIITGLGGASKKLSINLSTTHGDGQVHYRDGEFVDFHIKINRPAHVYLFTLDYTFDRSTGRYELDRKAGVERLYPRALHGTPHAFSPGVKLKPKDFGLGEMRVRQPYGCSFLWAVAAEEPLQCPTNPSDKWFQAAALPQMVRSIAKDLTTIRYAEAGVVIETS